MEAVTKTVFYFMSHLLDTIKMDTVTEEFIQHTITLLKSQSL